MAEPESGVLPLKLAYSFLETEGLSNEVHGIRTSRERLGSYSTTLRRAKVVALLKRKALLEKFLTDGWPNGVTPEGRRHLKFLVGLHERYEKSRSFPIEKEDVMAEHTSDEAKPANQQQEAMNVAGAPSQDTDELVVEEEKEPEPEYQQASTAVRRIFSKLADPTVKDLYDRYKEGGLLLQPGFQRHFVWDHQKSSRLVESAILEVPLPIIYLAEEADDHESVIDGQQRLTSFFKFIDGEIALTGLQVRRDLNGKRYADLDKNIQGTLRKTALRTITIQKESDKELKFEIFERLNTGSVALNDQELRNCIFRGPYNGLLIDLATDPDFMFLIGLSKPETRMRDVELVLRFAAFYHSTYLKYRPPIRSFLNNDMEKYQNISVNEATDLRRAFKISVQTIRSLLGKNAFKRFYGGTAENPNGRWELKKFNTSLYDILMYGFTIYDKNQVYPHLDSIRETLIWLMTEDKGFIDSIELSTSSLKMVTTRFDRWRLALQQVVGMPQTEPRCFSRQLKSELFEQGRACAICGQAIQDLDDAAVDHVEQYWLGGKTIPENARLAHRYCNGARPRKES